MAPDNSHTLSVSWLERRTAKSACRLSGGRAEEQRRHQGESGRLLAPGSAAYRWLALGGQLGQRASRRLDGRRPATASRSSSRVTRPGAGVQGEPTAASSSRLAGFSSVAVWRQTEGWRAALQGIGRKWRTQATTQDSVAENSN